MYIDTEAPNHKKDKIMLFSHNNEILSQNNIVLFFTVQGFHINNMFTIL